VASRGGFGKEFAKIIILLRKKWLVDLYFYVLVDKKQGPILYR
jgi:hypothetical protein